MKEEFWVAKGRQPVFRCADCDRVVRLYRGHLATYYVGNTGQVEFAWCAKCAAKQSAAAEVFRRKRKRT